VSYKKFFTHTLLMFFVSMIIYTIMSHNSALNEFTLAAAAGGAMFYTFTPLLMYVLIAIVYWAFKKTLYPHFAYFIWSFWLFLMIINIYFGK